MSTCDRDGRKCDPDAHYCDAPECTYGARRITAPNSGTTPTARPETTPVSEPNRNGRKESGAQPPADNSEGAHRSCRNTPTPGLPPCECIDKCGFDGMRVEPPAAHPAGRQAEAVAWMISHPMMLPPGYYVEIERPDTVNSETTVTPLYAAPPPEQQAGAAGLLAECREWIDGKARFTWAGRKALLDKLDAFLKESAAPAVGGEAADPAVLLNARLPTRDELMRVLEKWDRSGDSYEDGADAVLAAIAKEHPHGRK
jgi:hypothetical protein